MAETSFYRIGVLSDTHGYLHPALFDLFDGVQLILHAGDIGRDDVLVELRTIAPVQAVAGNVDLPDPRARPLIRQLETPAGRIAMTHGHLAHASAHDHASLLGQFAGFQPGIIIFGHSHLPLIEELDGVKLFNPGAAGRAGLTQHGATVGMISVEEGSGQVRLEHLKLSA
ncbi:MAG TPA: metallophosphoesterase family protein [Candidatus Sumerlaeota bacterium]|nr:MAG: hypothetical protein BWZ08_02237 [candidate division BRC1 bacterium ADurb.BinA292]HOR28074.1 metallophosphoesterase family protein [Candidatus Sumerlaeota bacterium]HPK03212.1 metallophosphoesterase family protein [Candidatus Sumerlaeota bacterium]